MRPALACLAWLAIAMQMMPAMAQTTPTVRPEHWAAYKQKFVDPGGRVIDDGNGGISHSESQGYGMLLAYLAGNRVDFDVIWSFTRRELLLRDDGLAVWKWDPSSTPHVVDTNNATDGDMLIAYALALAGQAWELPQYTSTAADIVRAIAAKTLITHNGQLIILPGAEGFSAAERPDGPVVNLSYWVFEALPVFAALDPGTDWKAVSDSGLTLIDQTMQGGETLPPEWLSLAARPRPAKGFPAEFSYNAVRIPLYLARSNLEADAALRRLAERMSADDGVGVVNLERGEVKKVLTDPGYRIIPALAACVAGGPEVPADLLTFEPTLYYPSTLHLLAIARLAERPCR